MITSGLCVQRRANFGTGFTSLRDQNPRNDVIAPFVQKDVYSTLTKSNYEKPLEQEYVTQQVFYDRIFGGKLTADERAIVETDKLNARKPQFAKTGATRKGRKGPKGPNEFEDPFLAEFNARGGDYMDMGTQNDGEELMNVDGSDKGRTDDMKVDRFLDTLNIAQDYRDNQRFNQDDDQNNSAAKSTKTPSTGMAGSLASDLIDMLAASNLITIGISKLDKALNSEVDIVASASSANSMGSSKVRGQEPVLSAKEERNERIRKLIEKVQTNNKVKKSRKRQRQRQKNMMAEGDDK